MRSYIHLWWIIDIIWIETHPFHYCHPTLMSASVVLHIIILIVLIIHLQSQSPSSIYNLPHPFAIFILFTHRTRCRWGLRWRLTAWAPCQVATTPVIAGGLDLVDIEHVELDHVELDHVELEVALNLEGDIDGWLCWCFCKGWFWMIMLSGEVKKH